MKKLFLFAALAAALTGCSSNDTTPEPGPGEIVVDMLPKTQAVELTGQQRAFVNQNTDFAFNLFRAVSSLPEGRKSSLLSPISVTYVMGMLHDGAAGQTAKEIASVIGFGEGQPKAVNEFCRALIEGAPKTDPSVTLEIANTAIANKVYSLNWEPQYKQDMADYYSADISSLDFSQKADAVSQVNGWCNEKTHGMIPEILSERELSSNSLLLLMNAIYFKATWTEKFDPKDTSEQPFTTASGQKRQLPMMHRKALAVYGEDDVCSALTLPYGSGDKWAMKVLLPKEGKTVDDVIEGLNTASWNSLGSHPNVWNPTVDIRIPRFTTAFETDLIKPLSALGAPTMFTPKKADFPNIFTNYKKGLHVGLMKQKAAIEVSEEGTKAAAVTVAEMECTSVGPDNRHPMNVDFHCDRPFVYVIQEYSSGAIFFIGTYRGE